MDGVRDADGGGDDEALDDALADAEAVTDDVVLAVTLEVGELDGVLEADMPVVMDGVTGDVGDGVG